MRPSTVLALAGALIPVASAANRGPFRFRDYGSASTDISARDVFNFRKHSSSSGLSARQYSADQPPISESSGDYPPPPPPPADDAGDYSDDYPPPGDYYGDGSDGYEEGYGNDDYGDDGDDGYGDDYGDDGDDYGDWYNDYEYIDAMCYPDVDESLYDTADASGDWSALPPCIAYSALSVYCSVNGTDEIDNIAEQECMCNGGFFEALSGCNACIMAHGGAADFDWYSQSELDTLQSSFCSAKQPEEFYELAEETLLTDDDDDTSYSTGSDIAPSNTAVSVYFTATQKYTAGAITGSATAAAYDSEYASESGYQGSATNSLEASLATHTGHSSIETGLVTKTVSSTTSGSQTGSATSSTTIPTITSNAAAELRASGLLAAIVVGAGLVL